jgi:hypothetical protein
LALAFVVALAFAFSFRSFLMPPPLADVMLSASCNVLETMFFAEGVPAPEDELPLPDALACALHYTGAETGSFHVVIDRPALAVLCSGFYGDDAEGEDAQNELLCELTNMLAGSTLSLYVPDHCCSLSSPTLYDRATSATQAHTGEHITRLTLAIEDGLLAIECSLRDHAVAETAQAAA